MKLRRKINIDVHIPHSGIGSPSIVFNLKVLPSNSHTTQKVPYYFGSSFSNFFRSLLPIGVPNPLVGSVFGLLFYQTQVTPFSDILQSVFVLHFSVHV
jgi:hypothetical protein